jgi:hypothetical protein
VITLKDSCKECISAASLSGPESSPQALTHEHVPEGSNSTRKTASVAGAKCPFEADDKSEGSLMCAKTEAEPSSAEVGPSTLKVITKPYQPQHLPEGKILLVVPPMPKSLYDELTDNSLTEPKSSENEHKVRKIEMKASN